MIEINTSYLIKMQIGTSKYDKMHFNGYIIILPQKAFCYKISVKIVSDLIGYTPFLC